MGRLFADTSQVVEDELIKRLGRLPPWRKLEIVAELNIAVREMLLAGLRRRYPEDSPEQLRQRLVVVLFRDNNFGPNQRAAGVPTMQSGPIDIMPGVAHTFDSVGIDYIIGGSLASAYYGVGRSTLDVDFVADIHVEYVDALVQTLQEEFILDESAIRGAIEKQGSINLIHLSSMFKVDGFIPQSREFDRLQLARREALDIDYLRESASGLEVSLLLEKALPESDYS